MPLVNPTESSHQRPWVAHCNVSPPSTPLLLPALAKPILWQRQAALRPRYAKATGYSGYAVRKKKPRQRLCDCGGEKEPINPSHSKRRPISGQLSLDFSMERLKCLLFSPCSPCNFRKTPDVHCLHCCANVTNQEKRTMRRGWGGVVVFQGNAHLAAFGPLKV